MELEELFFHEKQQYVTNAEIKALIGEMRKGFEKADIRFEEINKRFEDMNRRFEDLMRYTEKRFSYMQWLIMILFSSLISTLFYFHTMSMNTIHDLKTTI